MKSGFEDAPLDIPKRLLDVWREITQAHGSKVADQALIAGRRLFPGTSPAQLLQTYQFNVLHGTHTRPAAEWEDFRSKPNGQPVELGKRLREWFMGKANIGECFVKSETLIGLARRYGLEVLAEVADGIRQTGTADLNVDGLQTWFTGSFKRQRLPVDLTEAQVGEQIR